MKIAILGVGLIGGSIGLAAKRDAEARVSGYDPEPEAGARALALGAIDERAETIAEAVKDADVVFAAAPIGWLATIVIEALEHADSDCVVSDVGSTKLALELAANDGRFVGGHPLAGAETAGVEHARADLFAGASWYLTPTQGTSGVLYERLHRLLVSFGAQPTAIDAKLHDRLMACFSHLPHVLANLLVAQGSARAQELSSGERLPAAGPSFRDATRVAGANTAIWRDIYISNRLALIGEIGGTIERLEQVRALLEEGDADAVAAWNDRAREQRDALLGAGLAGETSGEPVRELRASVPNRPGVVADIALALGGAGVNILDMALSPSPDDSQGVIALWLRGETAALRGEQLIHDLGFPVARA
ncbi:MAG TPA: prephenate dehydrogenase/arogenate dehydrogenase family protein [Solirubrobacteraceae bacterium]|nr:prephenate dehydrogenase/arogenate dehydrogenase family protein [Solirubrobacteraceae bacterium]